MRTQFTAREVTQFHAFAKRHGLRFANMTEYLAAIAQYFKKSWYNYHIDKKDYNDSHAVLLTRIV